MRFWDASGLVPLLFDQDTTRLVRPLLKDDPEIAAWWGAPVECASAAARLRRKDRITVVQEERVLELLATLRESWFEVLPADGLRSVAMRLLRTHSLRAADALQLAAALTWSGGQEGSGLITFDERLGLAARLEGFSVLP